MSKLDVQKFREYVATFPENTSIHGILYIFQKKLERWSRLGWLFLFFIMLSLTLYNCQGNVKDYLEFAVKVSTTREYVDELEFPAITFCTNYYLKRSQFGNVSFLNLMLAGVFATNDKEIQSILLERDRTCKSDFRSNVSVALENMGLDGLFTNTDLFLDLIRQSVTDFRADVAKCWWQEREMTCGDVLVNIMGDVQHCFSFNLGENVTDILKAAKGSGLNYSSYNESIYRVTSPATSKFQMLIKVNQSESCGAAVIKRGSGFFAMVTEKNVFPSTSYSKPLYFTPGYINRVILKPVYYKRYTEHMGKCLSTMRYLLTDNQRYIQLTCYAECIGFKMLYECKCFAPHFIIFRDALKNMSKDLNIPNSSFVLCHNDGLMCMRELFQSQILNNNPMDTCPRCNLQCYQEKYDYLLTKSLITQNLLEKDVSVNEAFKTRTFEELRNNYLYLSFGFESSNVEIVEEKQAMTLSNLFVYMGGNIGLFLGMSFMSVFEILVELLLHALYFVCRLWSHHCSSKSKEPISTISIKKRRKRRPKNKK